MWLLIGILSQHGYVSKQQKREFGDIIEDYISSLLTTIIVLLILIMNSEDSKCMSTRNLRL